MAGSGKNKRPESLKNKAMLVIRNITKQEVTNVVFPNGLTVGTDDLLNGAKIHGNVQVKGIVNAEGLRVDGVPFTGAGGFPFLFLDVNSNVFAFDNAADTASSPASITLTALQISGSSTLPESAFQVSGSDGTDLISHLGSHTVSESTTGNATRNAVLTYNDSAMRAKFPITTKIVHEGLSSTKLISKVQGGEQGATPATLVLDLDTNVISFDDSSDTTPSPSTVGITVTQTGQASTLVAGDITAQTTGGSSVTVSSFNVTATSTGNSVATAQINAATNQSNYPLTVTVANDGLTSSKKVAKAVGGSAGSSLAYVTWTGTIIPDPASGLYTAFKTADSSNVLFFKSGISPTVAGQTTTGLSYEDSSSGNAAGGTTPGYRGPFASGNVSLAVGEDPRHFAVVVPPNNGSSVLLKSVTGKVTISGTSAGGANREYELHVYVTKESALSGGGQANLLSVTQLDINGSQTESWPNGGTATVEHAVATTSGYSPATLSPGVGLCVAIGHVDQAGFNNNGSIEVALTFVIQL